MSLIRKGAVIRQVKNIGLSGSLLLALGTAGWVGCSPSANQEEEYSYEEVTYTKGVISHIREVEPGEFRIMDEETVSMSEAKAIVTYLDGHTDTLSVETAKALIEREIAQNPEYRHHSGLSNMLLYGGMGYILGRMMGNGAIAARHAQAPNTSGFYGSPAAYEKSQAVHRDVNASRVARTVKSRPSNSRSGFMGTKGGRSFGG